MILASISLLEQHPHPTDDRIRAGLPAISVVARECIASSRSSSSGGG
jgi:hypothetical protein